MAGNDYVYLVFEMVCEHPEKEQLLNVYADKDVAEQIVKNARGRCRVEKREIIK